MSVSLELMISDRLDLLKLLPVLFPAFEDYLRGRVFVRMGERNVYAAGAKFVEDPFCLSGYEEAGCAFAIDVDLNVLPGDLTAPTCSDRLQKGLFCSKPRRIGLRRRGALCVTVFPLALGENPFNKAGSSFDGLPDAVNLDDVCAD